MRIRIKDLQRRIELLDARIQERQRDRESIDSIELKISTSPDLYDISRLYLDIGRKLELELLLENREIIT